MQLDRGSNFEKLNLDHDRFRDHSIMAKVGPSKFNTEDVAHDKPHPLAHKNAQRRHNAHLIIMLENGNSFQLGTIDKPDENGIKVEIMMVYSGVELPFFGIRITFPRKTNSHHDTDGPNHIMLFKYLPGAFQFAHDRVDGSDAQTIKRHTNNVRHIVKALDEKFPYVVKFALGAVGNVEVNGYIDEPDLADDVTLAAWHQAAEIPRAAQVWAVLKAPDGTKEHMDLFLKAQRDFQDPIEHYVKKLRKAGLQWGQVPKPKQLPEEQVL